MDRKRQCRRAGSILCHRLGRAAVILLALTLAQTAFAHASVALLMEEPYGDLGKLTPTGHSAIYLNHVCAASPTELRACRPGESGVVISRYHKIDKLDWVAVPLIPYLYAVQEIPEVPQSADQAQVNALRDTYRREYLKSLAPDDAQGREPKGEWTELVGESYDRTIHGFEVASTAEQDQRFIAIFNDRHNRGHFNIMFHNCADFSRVVMDIYLPHAIHRSIVADLGMTTPKQVARSLVRYGQKHPELEMSAFVIPQVPGAIPRSHPVDGIAESLVKSKKYLIPITILTPELTGGLVVAYMTEGRMKMPKNVMVFDVNDNEMEPGAPWPAQATNTNPDRTPLPAPAAATAPAALATASPGASSTHP